MSASAQRRRPVPRIAKRRPIPQRVRDVVEPGGRVGQVEVDQRDGQAVAEDHVARAVVAVADQLDSLSDRASQVGRRPAPHRIGRRHPPGRHFVQRTDQPGQGDEYVVARRLRRERVARHVTGDERQHLPPLLVDAERKRRAGEPGVAQVGQVSLHGQAEGPQRPAHRVPDPHDPLGDAIPDQELALAHTQQPNLRPAPSGAPASVGSGGQSGSGLQPRGGVRPAVDHRVNAMRAEQVTRGRHQRPFGLMKTVI